MHLISQAKQAAQKLFPSLWVHRQLKQRPPSAERELSLLRNFIEPDDVTVDVGANLGLYTRELADRSSLVHAFEPSPAMADILRRTTARNVVVHETALSDHSGMTELKIPADEGRLTHSLASLEPGAVEGFEVNEVSVPLARLDDVVSENVSFVKIDVEGHELNVLEGAQGLIERCRPIFLVEAEERHRNGATRSLFEFFTARNYRGFFLYRDDLVAAEKFDPRIHQDTGALRPDGGRRNGSDYINNFFFVPAERNGRAALTA